MSNSGLIEFAPATFLRWARPFNAMSCLVARDLEPDSVPVRRVLVTAQQQPASRLVSVIISVYNGASFLPSAIRNVLEQDWRPLEIIVVDDGSTDDTARIAAGFEHDIRYIRQPHGGLAAARNQGIQMALGTVVAFLDVDDAWPPHRLRRQVSYLLRHPEIDIVQGLIVQMQRDSDAPGPEHIYEECSEPYQFVTLGSAVYRRALFDSVGLFDETLVENDDIDWFFRAWDRNVPKVVQDQVALYDRRDAPTMLLARQSAYLKVIKVFKRHLDRRRAQGPVAGSELSDRPTIAAYIGRPPEKNHVARVRDETFTVISNDCWGSGVYDHTRLMYRTPFIGTRIFAPCYIEMLRDLKAYLQSPLEFVTVSRYGFMNDQRQPSLGFYPIALLHGNVEVHFMHETDEATARQKWERRRAKINWDNLFVKFSQDPTLCTPALLEEFDSLEYPYKVCFTRKTYPPCARPLLSPTISSRERPCISCPAATSMRSSGSTSATALTPNHIGGRLLLSPDR